MWGCLAGQAANERADERHPANDSTPAADVRWSSKEGWPASRLCPPCSNRSALNLMSLIGELKFSAKPVHPSIHPPLCAKYGHFYLQALSPALDLAPQRQHHRQPSTHHEHLQNRTRNNSTTKMLPSDRPEPCKRHRRALDLWHTCTWLILLPVYQFSCSVPFFFFSFLSTLRQGCSPGVFRVIPQGPGNCSCAQLTWTVLVACGPPRWAALCTTWRMSPSK